jgi:hypothetical protein
MAEERGFKVAEIKTQRERLERERVRIMDDLERIKSGTLPSRRNDAAIRVADQKLKTGRTNLDSNIEPSLKEKLSSD